jgi:Histidine kinase-, DNA gyrase B-, and HSP90-like ATPase
VSTKSTSIVALDRFILSTRDSGYKSTSSAVAELVDNALQAGATTVRVSIEASDAMSGSDVRIQIADDGAGMDRYTLVQAMRFGGSGRYNDRSGLGRFGMGLPNASLGQARRVSVFTWQSAASVLSTHLDVDEIAEGGVDSVPEPIREKTAANVDRINIAHGTTVVWERCDRLDSRRPSALVRRLSASLGRIFRYFIEGGIRIEMNGSQIKPVDPLYLSPNAVQSGARQFQSTWTCDVHADAHAEDSPVGTVHVRFTELPVDAWHDLSNDQKRDLGVANGAGVSIVRAGREVDFGWFFMGAKRRENYDDWWRCEVRFEPVLDEAFGITHTKQQIRPKDYLVEALTDFIETTAKALNARVRDAFAAIKTSKASDSAEQVALARDARMKPLPAPAGTGAVPPSERALLERNPLLRRLRDGKKNGATTYHLVEDELGTALFLEPIRVGNAIVGVVNPRHQFYRQVYGPIVSGKELDAERVASAMRLTVLAAARAEASFTSPGDRAVLAAFRAEWSQAMDVLLAKR